MVDLTSFGPTTVEKVLGISYDPGGGLPFADWISGFQRLPKPSEVDLGLKVEFGFRYSISILLVLERKRGSFEKLQPVELVRFVS